MTDVEEDFLRYQPKPSSLGFVMKHVYENFPDVNELRMLKTYNVKRNAIINSLEGLYHIVTKMNEV
jgi:hypothetical protein